MSGTTEDLRRKLASAGELRSVVRTMKALAASSIGQYDRSVLALADYYRTVELGLGACFRAGQPEAVLGDGPPARGPARCLAIVFGTDQGLVGQFNDVVADFTLSTLAALPGKPLVWAVGERLQARLGGAGFDLRGHFSVPTSVEGITGLVGKIQIACESSQGDGDLSWVYVFHNRPTAGSVYEPVSQRLLPLDAQWRQNLARVPWPAHHLPETLGDATGLLRALTREYLFISLFQACAESLASENASRLAAMQRADKNIDELLDTLNHTFNNLRQSSIDEELFEVVSGFEALQAKHGRPAQLA